MAHHSHHDSQTYHSHASLYAKIFGVLIVFTVITVLAAKVDFAVLLGERFAVLNIIIAMLIASVKAMLVALFFMHLKSEKPMTWIYAAFPVILMFLLIAGVFIDNPFRYGAGEGTGVFTKSATDQAPHSGSLQRAGN